MANKTIHQLSAMNEFDSGDEFAVYDTSANTTGKMTIANVLGTSITGLGTTATTIPGAISELNTGLGTVNTLLGSGDISSIGDGSVTGAISSLNNDLGILNTFMNQQALFFDAAWTGTTSSAVGTVLTNSLTLPKGRYILYGQAPVASTSISTAWCVLNGNSNLSHRTATYYSMLTYGRIIDYIVAIRDNATAWLETSSSASITFDYLSRGFIRAIKIGEYE